MCWTVTTSSVSFTVMGQPVPAKRMTQRSKWVRPDAGRHLAHKEAIGWAALDARRRYHLPAPWFDGPVRLTARFFGAHPLADLGNCVKLVEDALQGIAYRNDRLVKRYGEGTGMYDCALGEEPRTEIVIEPIERSDA